MTIKNTYIVTHSNIVTQLKNISHFKLHLGTAIVDKGNQFNPSDVIIQKHYILHNQIIHSLGYIGSLPVYNQNQIPMNTILFCNEKETFTYKMDPILSVYDNINLGLDLLFKKLGYSKTVSTIKENEPQPVEYQKPNKSFKDFTEAERIAYAAAQRISPSV